MSSKRIPDKDNSPTALASDALLQFSQKLRAAGSLKHADPHLGYGYEMDVARILEFMGEVAQAKYISGYSCTCIQLHDAAEREFTKSEHKDALSNAYSIACDLYLECLKRPSRPERSDSLGLN